MTLNTIYTTNFALAILAANLRIRFNPLLESAAHFNLFCSITFYHLPTLYALLPCQSSFGTSVNWTLNELEAVEEEAKSHHNTKWYDPEWRVWFHCYLLFLIYCHHHCKLDNCYMVFEYRPKLYVYLSVISHEPVS